MRKKLIYLIIPVLATMLLFSFAVACGGSTTTTKKSGDTTDTTAVVETTLQQVYSVGESVNLGGTTVTVTKFDKSNGSDFDRPKDGMEYVIVSIKIKNDSSEKISYNPFDFKMQNSKGQITDTVFTTIDSKTALSSGELASGGEAEGTVTFEQPKGDTGLVLLYQPNFLNEDEVIKINIK
jgi:hypothetical protein